MSKNLPRTNLAIAALTAATLHAGVIRGTVVENFTSKPLAHASIVVQPLATGESRTARADAHGNFTIGQLSAGSYVVRASRNNYMPAEYGQKRWNSAGTPVKLPPEGSVFLEFRLFRFSAVSGTVVDQNDVGMPDYPVVAYRVSGQTELMSQSITDDRGVYRLHGLPPGPYVVRSAGSQSADVSFIPTFSRETEKREESVSVDLTADQDTDNVDVRPILGRLYSLNVTVERIPPGADVAITLVSDLGRQTVRSSAAHFPNLPPGDYEVFAQSPAEPAGGDDMVGAYQRIPLGGPASVTLILRPAARITANGGPSNQPSQLRLRHADLAGGGITSTITVRNGAATIPVGHWDVMLVPPAGFYVSAVSGSSTQGHSRPDGWQEMLSPGYGLRFTLSGNASAVHGVIKNGGDPVAGAPVYLEAYLPTTRQRAADLRTALTDTQGQYRFDSLAPGAYRILATFEYLAPDQQTMDLAEAPTLTIDAHSDTARDLDLYIIH